MIDIGSHLSTMYGRKVFLLVWILAFSCGASGGKYKKPCDEGKRKRPNVVFIMADDLGKST